MDNIITFPDRRKDVLKQEMHDIELEIQQKVENLQELNQEIVQLTLEYERKLIVYCEETGIDMPKGDWVDE